MNYVKYIDTFTLLPDNFEKLFYNVPGIKPSKEKIMNLKEGGAITSDDMDIIEFLFKVGFATHLQVSKYCHIKGIKKVQRRLNLMFNNAIINKVSFVDDNKQVNKIPEDALIVYCLSDGGKYLIDHYTSLATYNWDSSIIYQSSRNIANKLFSTELYIKVLGNEKSPVSSISSDYYMMYKNVKIIPSFVYRIASQNVPFYLITEVIRADMDILELRNLIHNYESFFATQHYKRFFPDVVALPYIVFLTDDDNAALKLCNEVVISSRLTNVIYTTPERLGRGLDTQGSFLTFNPSTNQLIEATFKIF